MKKMKINKIKMLRKKSQAAEVKAMQAEVVRAAVYNSKNNLHQTKDYFQILMKLNLKNLMNSSININSILENFRVPKKCVKMLKKGYSRL